MLAVGGRLRALFSDAATAVVLMSISLLVVSSEEVATDLGELTTGIALTGEGTVTVDLELAG